MGRNLTANALKGKANGNTLNNSRLSYTAEKVCENGGG